MQVNFFSEIGTQTGIIFPRDFVNARTDTSWAISLDAPVYSFDANNFELGVGIIIVPKNNPERAFDFFERNKKKSRRWAVMQEADQISWQRYDVVNQTRYINLLFEVNHILCHNESDVRYYNGLSGSKKAAVMPSLMILDAIPQPPKIMPENRTSCIIGGTMCDWYSGMDSFVIAQTFQCDVFAPSMGRKAKEEEYLDGLTFLPYMKWSQWIDRLQQFKYAVHLMRTFAAGTFPLNCAYWGIPCIGWDGCDTQRICFPELTFKEGDMVSARKAAQRLVDDENFYAKCSQLSKEMYQRHFSEELFLSKMSKILRLGL